MVASTQWPQKPQAASDKRRHSNSSSPSGITKVWEPRQARRRRNTSPTCGGTGSYSTTTLTKTTTRSIWPSPRRPSRRGRSGSATGWREVQYSPVALWYALENDDDMITTNWYLWLERSSFCISGIPFRLLPSQNIFKKTNCSSTSCRRASAARNWVCPRSTCTRRTRGA